MICGEFVATNRVSVVKIQRRLDKPPPTFKQFSFHCHFTNSSPKSIMPPKPNTSRREYLDKETGKSYTQITDQVKILRPSVVYIIYRATRTQNEP